MRADESAALVIPGGQSPDHLRADPRFVELVTSRQPDDLEAFSKAVLEALGIRR